MLVLGEITGAIVVVDTDFQCFCLKCKEKTEITKEVYKAKNTKVIIEKGNCRKCGTKNRSFRKFMAFSSENYKKLHYFGLYHAKRYSKMRWWELLPPDTTLTSNYIIAAKNRCTPSIYRHKTVKQSNWGGWIGAKPMPPRSRPGGSVQQNPYRYRPGGSTMYPQQQPYGYAEQNQAHGQYMRGIAGMVRNELSNMICPNCSRFTVEMHGRLRCECESQ